MPKLSIAGNAHELIEEIVTIGRAPDNVIVIDDPSVSGHHAQLQRSGESYRVKDLSSTNGTRINGVPITESALRFEDRVRFGAVEARFESDISKGTQPLPQPEEIEARPADASARPLDFANASPFRERAKEKDAVRTALLAAAGLALLAFLVSMIAVLMMRVPGL